MGIRIELNSAGIRELLKSAEIRNVCEAEAEKMTRATGMKYTPDVSYTSQRVAAKGQKEIDSVDTLDQTTDSRKGRTVKGYWRKGKNGQMIYVQSYKRKN